MAKVLKNRSENDIKNKWNSMKRKSLRKTKPSSAKLMEPSMSSENDIAGQLGTKACIDSPTARGEGFVPRDWSKAGKKLDTMYELKIEEI